MASQGPNSAAQANGAGWTNPTNALTNNDADATYVLMVPGNTGTLFLYDWGFSIPAGSTIDGIEVSIERNSSGQIKDLNLALWKDFLGTPGPVTNNKADTVNNWPTTGDEVKVYGASDDDWGYSDSTDILDFINSNDWAVGLQATTSAMGQAQVDHITVTVYYTEASGQPASQSRSMSGVGQ